MTKAERIEAMATGMVVRLLDEPPLRDKVGAEFWKAMAEAAYDAADVGGMVQDGIEEALTYAKLEGFGEVDIDAIVGRVCGNE